MIETFFSLGQLDTANALFMSLVTGILFGIALEQAGFGSSRRLSGVFYFKDMAVIKVMFTAMITAIICLQTALSFGWISEQALYLNPTLYKAQIIGGIIFGIGFVMGGWCPGTAAVGAASGKWDALIFLGGAVAGSALFNETYFLVQGLYAERYQHLAFIYDSLGLGREWFCLLFVAAGILIFWCMELIENKTIGKSAYLNSQFLKRFSFVLAAAGFFLFLVTRTLPVADTREVADFNGTARNIIASESSLLSSVNHAEDHMEPEELAQRIFSGSKDIVLVDIRPEDEFARFHIRTAKNIQLKDLAEQLEPYKNKGWVVLYSNGMTHPAQARDALFRIGYQNAYLLTDGLEGFVERCLKPVSLRSEPIPENLAAQINQWRRFFLTDSGPPDEFKKPVRPVQNLADMPTLIDPQLLAARVTNPDTRVIDLRSQPEYNTAHIPGAFALNIESLRGNLFGVPSCLLPAAMISQHLSLMGVRPETFVVLVYGDKVQDATLAGMALERLAHEEYTILSGGFTGWKSAGMATDTKLPDTAASSYPTESKDQFTVDYKTVLSHMNHRSALILDVRPKAYYTGEKSDEARAGHIPGAINRPFDQDTQKTGEMLEFKPIPELQTVYEKIIPEKNSPVIVHCRNGHQASQTFFVLRHLLGYSNILWYDAGWTEWAARTDLPVKIGDSP